MDKLATNHSNEEGNSQVKVLRFNLALTPSKGYMVETRAPFEMSLLIQVKRIIQIDLGDINKWSA